MTRGSDNTEVEAEARSRIDARRRRLIAALGTGVTAGVAGCGGGGDGTTEPEGGDGDGTPGDGDGTPGDGDGTPGDGTGTSTDGDGSLPDTDRTYGTFHVQDLSEINWTLYNHREHWPRLVNSFAHAYKVSFDQQSGELIPMLITDWSADANTIEFEFRESGWSDGSGNIHPRDWGIVQQLNRWQSETRPEDLSEDNPPQDWFTATSSFEWDDTTLRYVSDDGWYDRFVTDNIIQGQLDDPAGTNLGNKITTPADPYFAPIWEEAQELGDWEERKARIDEWDDNETGEHLENWTQNEAGDWYPEDPTAQPNSGPFALTEVTETEIILEKNENYWGADRINWPRVRADTMLEERNRNQALVNDELDGFTGQEYTPQANVLDQLGDDWDWHSHNPDNTSGLALNSNTIDYFGDPRVRQAIYLCLDKEDIATQGHAYANTAPPEPPGLNSTSFNNSLPEDANLDAFDRYEMDLDRATELLEAAGFSQQGGAWTTPEGEEVSFELLADAENPQVPALIQGYLDQAGFSVDLVTNEATTVTDRKVSGDWQAAMQGWWVYHTDMWVRAIQQSARRHRFGMHSDEAIDDWVAEYEDEGVENIEYEWTYNLEGWDNEMMQDFTIPVPPVGERPTDTDPENMRQASPFFFSSVFENNLADEELSQYALELCWAMNWYLPYLPIAVTNQLAVQNHTRWNAPTDEQTWMQHRPNMKLIQQGDLTAAEE